MKVQPCPSERLGELFELRARVWIQEGALPSAFPDGRWSDAGDATRQHWIVTNEAGQIVAGASLSLHSSLDDVDEADAYVGVVDAVDGPVASPARVIVDSAYRGAGLAQLLLDTQDAAADLAGARVSVRQASPAMRRLLERRGWRSHGPAPADPRFPGVEFTVMSRPQYRASPRAS